ncbi:MAG: TIM barrel protein, partial [Actinomycetota bacterium]|nr:TIM barrel protein [Actinomycetota bacterium]
MDLELSASLPALYGGLPFAAACAAAATDGFRCVETWEAPPEPEWSNALRALATHDLSLTSVNTTAGESPAFGLAADQTAVSGWRADFVHTLEFTRRAGASAINVLAGARVVGQTRPVQLSCLRANLEWVLELMEPDDPALLLEPLNGADRDSPLLCRVDDAVAVLEQVSSDQARLLFDAYHLYQEEEDLLGVFDRALPYVGHVQVADFPGRGEPGSGELPWKAFLAHVARSGYRGRVGCEFLPTHPDAIAPTRV